MVSAAQIHTAFTQMPHCQILIICADHIAFIHIQIIMQFFYSYG